MYLFFYRYENWENNLLHTSPTMKQMGPMWNAIFCALSPKHTSMNIGTNLYQSALDLISQLRCHDNLDPTTQVIAVTHSDRAAHFHKSNGFTQITPKLIPYEDDGEVKFLVHVLKHRPCYEKSSGESDKFEYKIKKKPNGSNVDRKNVFSTFL